MWVSILMYEITCTLSREKLLALYLANQTMPASRIREMKVHGAQLAQGGQWGGSGGTAGRFSMDQLESGKCGVRAFCLCCPWSGAERPDRKLFWSGSRCIELSGAEPWRDTAAPGAHLRVSSMALPEPPPFPSWAPLTIRHIFLCTVRCPVMASCTDTCRAGHSARALRLLLYLIQPAWVRQR